MVLLHAAAMPTPLETVSHGPLLLAGRLSCQSLRRNATRGLVTSSAQPEGRTVQWGQILESHKPQCLLRSALTHLEA